MKVVLHEPLLPPAENGDGKYSLDPKRFYIIAVFSFISFLQSLQWLTFSSIPYKTNDYFPTTNLDTIFLLLNWGPIVFLPVVFVTSWLMTQPNGVRKCILLAAGLTVLGSTCRCIPCFLSEDFRATDSAVALLHLGQIFNAAAGPLVMAPPTQLSVTWFGEHERATATAVSTVCNSLGSAVGFFLGPLVVHSKDQVPNLLFLELGLAALAAAFIFFHFPNNPKVAPNAIALRREQPTDSNTNFLRSLWILSGDPSFVVLVTVGGLAAGVYNAWSGCLPTVLKPLGFGEDEAGWMAFGGTMAGILAALLVGHLSDRYFPRRYKKTLLTCFTVSFLVFCWLTLSLPEPFIDYNVFGYQLGSPSNVGLTIAVAGMFLGAANPVFFEFAAELSYPIPEGTSAGALVFINNVGCLCFLFIVPQIPNQWLNVIIACNVLLCTIALSFVKESYKRAAVEQNLKGK
eukprot:GILJ01002972.1.p1 GENE.GILJ01002972.1~~GILJ01002972.1.p1  ORF type:complete len:458 (-),score=57.19 GILJ01002972.1:377-1750(-)